MAYTNNDAPLREKATEALDREVDIFNQRAVELHKAKKEIVALQKQLTETQQEQNSLEWLVRFHEGRFMERGDVINGLQKQLDAAMKAHEHCTEEFENISGHCSLARERAEKAEKQLAELMGTPAARFFWLGKELKQRYPDPESVSARPYELRFLHWLDALLARCEVLAQEKETLMQAIDPRGALTDVAAAVFNSDGIYQGEVTAPGQDCDCGFDSTTKGKQ